MFLYNITTGIDGQIEREWVAWMKANYIPAVMETKLFVSWKMFKVLHDQEDGSVSYSVQYFSTSIENVVNFMQHIEPELNKVHQEKFKDRHASFRTLLEEA